MWLVTKDEEFGPICQGRHRRGADYSMNIGGLNGKSFQSDEVDMVFKEGYKFKLIFQIISKLVKFTDKLSLVDFEKLWQQSQKCIKQIRF